MAFPVEEKFIELAEAELGAKFPDSFRNKMIAMNGGEVDVSDDCYQLLPFMTPQIKNELKEHVIVLFMKQIWPGNTIDYQRI